MIKSSTLNRVGRLISETRAAKNLTQADLAKLVGTKQPSIARLEGGATLPSLSFLAKVAEALDAQLRILFWEEQRSSYTMSNRNVQQVLSNWQVSWDRESGSLASTFNKEKQYAHQNQ